MLWPWKRKNETGKAEVPEAPENLVRTLRDYGIELTGFRRYFGTDNEAIYGFTCTGDNSVPVWKKLTGAVERTGCRPIVLGVDNDLSFHQELIEEFVDDSSPTVDAVIAEGEALSPEAYLKSLADNWIDGGDFDIAIYHGPWPGPEEQQDFYSTTLSDAPIVHIGMVPTTTPWHIPAYLHFGGWNDCPRTAGHVSLFKRWFELYGALPVNMTHDVLEVYVARPITSKEEAIAVAEEHFWYCPDNVMQGVNTIEALAALLLNASQWYFWWD